MISPKFLWDYGHSTIPIWRRYNKFTNGERGSLPVDVRLTSGWRASLKNASKPRTNLVPRFLFYLPPERKRNLGTKLYKHAITKDRFHMTSRRPYLRTKQWIGGHVCVQKKIMWKLNSFLMLKLFFHSKQFAKPLTMPRDWKRSIDQQPSKPLILLVPITYTTYCFQG